MLTDLILQLILGSELETGRTVGEELVRLIDKNEKICQEFLELKNRLSK